MTSDHRGTNRGWACINALCRLMFMGDGCREGSVIFHYYPRDPSMGRKKRENTVRGGVKWQKWWWSYRMPPRLAALFSPAPAWWTNIMKKEGSARRTKREKSESMWPSPICFVAHFGLVPSCNECDGCPKKYTYLSLDHCWRNAGFGTCADLRWLSRGPVMWRVW